MAKKYANLSPYNYADNNPINDYDIDGMQNNNSAGTKTNGSNTTNTGTAQGVNPPLTAPATTGVTATYSPPANTPTVLDECSGKCQTVRGPIIGGTGGYNVDIPADAMTLTGKQSFPIAGKPDNKIDITIAFSITDKSGALKMFQWSPEVNAFYNKDSNEIYGGKDVAKVSGFASAAYGLPDYFAKHPSSAEGKAIGDIQFAVNMGVATVGLTALGVMGVRMALNRFGSIVANENFEHFMRLLAPSVDEFNPNVTLYRGTTGSEEGSASLYLTNNPQVAATYVKNGGQVMEYTVSEFSLFKLEQSGQLTKATGIHGSSNVVSTEYIFEGKDLVKAVNKFAKPH